MRAIPRPTAPVLFGLLLAALAGCSPLTDEEASATAVQLAVAAEDADATLSFGLDWSESLDGELNVGDTVALDYALDRLPDCRGVKYGQPAWSVLAYWRIDGGELSYTVLGGGGAPVAPELPAIELDAQGELELWFTNNDVYGCARWDSNFETNYRWTVDAAVETEPEQPTWDGWIGNGAWVISRPNCDGLPCPGSGTAMDEDFYFGTWARQRATIGGVWFEVWQAGVTDWDNPDLWQQLDVQVHHRHVGDEAWSWDYVDFVDLVGNNARFSFSFFDLDPYGWPQVMEEGYCPSQIEEIPGGYVQTGLEYFVTVNGVEQRPADGGSFSGAFVDYVGQWQDCLEQ
jgi:hypothetical protein